MHQKAPGGVLFYVRDSYKLVRFHLAEAFSAYNFNAFRLHSSNSFIFVCLFV